MTGFRERFVFIKGSIADKSLVDKIFDEYQPQIVVNLAAQAGVRYSITNPDAYIESNLIENKKRNTRENKYIKRKVTYAIDSKAQITISLS